MSGRGVRRGDGTSSLASHHGRSKRSVRSTWGPLASDAGCGPGSRPAVSEDRELAERALAHAGGSQVDQRYTLLTC